MFVDTDTCISLLPHLIIATSFAQTRARQQQQQNNLTRPLTFTSPHIPHVESHRLTNLSLHSFPLLHRNTATVYPLTHPPPTVSKLLPPPTHTPHSPYSQPTQRRHVHLLEKTPHLRPHFRPSLHRNVPSRLLVQHRLPVHQRRRDRDSARKPLPVLSVHQG